MTTVLAELGDVRDFPSWDRLVSWAGLAPSVCQSADALVCGKITRYRGSMSLRWILVQAARAASRTTDTVLSRFFRRIAYRRG
ncbi:MAG: transposase [Candidatus Methanoculleus thermohydrogenotrophicum]|nr:IS110 family transposase [Candidatus Methanoculleus thermohydrogenotrophicum]HQE09650.1 IS110 family transposase [Bacillota bacterium]HQE09694.1 IS110 family transposase [Bacillota bacterium]